MAARQINTAACLIIGDEVLNGKVIQRFSCTADHVDQRHQFQLFCKMVLRTGHRSEAHRGHR
jgi:hypothetical protein